MNDRIAWLLREAERETNLRRRAALILQAAGWQAIADGEAQTPDHCSGRRGNDVQQQ